MKGNQLRLWSYNVSQARSFTVSAKVYIELNSVQFNQMICCSQSALWDFLNVRKGMGGREAADQSLVT
jgi:hypothetical protein